MLKIPISSQYKEKFGVCQDTPSFHASGDEPARKLPVPALVGAGLLLAGGAWALGTLAYTWLATHPPRLPVVRPSRPKDPDWEDVHFPARDGVQIAGWFGAASNAQGIVILCHGHPMNRVEMLHWARLLHQAGFHTLLFDFRAMGQSEGNLSSIGYHEVNDLLGAVDYLSARPEMVGLPIGVFGISMGGAVSLMAAAQEPRLAAVATHGAYASLATAIRQRGRAYLGPAGEALSRPMTYWGKRWMDIEPGQVSPENVVAQIAPRPLLLSHGARDRIIHPRDADALHRAAGETAVLTVWPRSWHIRIHPTERPAYEAALLQFFQTHLKA